MQRTEADQLLASIQQGYGRKALGRLIGLGQEVLPVVRAGLWSGDWRIRRDCLRILDHRSDAESGRLIIQCLDDEHPEVRKWAAHALGCDRCKGRARGDFDAVPHLLRVVREDASLRVRRSTVVALAWNQPRDERIAACLRELLEVEHDPKIRMHAMGGLSRHCSGSV